MIHEISIVLIYATFVMLLVNYYTKRVDRLEDRIIDLENEIKTTLPTHTLIEKYKLYESDVFTGFGLSSLEEDFVRHGYIAEDYDDYISYFYPEIMSLSDHHLCLDIKLDRRASYDSKIDNVELLIRELPLYAFHYQSVWIYTLLDFLFDNHIT